MKKKIMWTLLIAVLVLIVGIISLKKDYNVLVYGLEGTRSDVMMVVMVSGATNTVDVISLPRDTYYLVEGKNGLGQAKLNAVYGHSGEEGLKKAAEDILGITIDGYVGVNYDGVEAIANLVGGIPVEVPFNMNYDDPYATPQLHIDIAAGEQILEGDDVIGYLRFRKSNDGKIREGDVQRIERQQAFLKSALKEILPLKFLPVMQMAMNYVETDISAATMATVGGSLIGISADDVIFHSLPEDRIGTGSDGLSYFYYSPTGTQTLISQILNHETRVAEQPNDEIKN